MKIIKIFSLLLIATALLTSCNNDEESGNVVLEAYGPSPVLRGGNIYFIGQNLDKISTIIFPENIEVTTFEVESKSKIKAVVPQDAVEGIVRLLTIDGQEIVSKSHLSFTEPIEITEISPLRVKPGAELTIKGDYLNLMSKVIFTGGAEVSSDDFKVWERDQITVVVPNTAKSGIITLSDGAEVPVELESEKEIEVILPSVSAVASIAAAKPNDVIELEGENLDLVESALLPGELSVKTTYANNKISFVIPEGTVDGEAYLVAFSGETVLAANIVMAVPEQLVAEPSDNLKENDVLKIKGINMELVTSVVFPGVQTAVVPSEKSETEISVIVPAMTVSGDLQLNTASGKSATIAISTLKPTVTGYNPSSATVGETVEIQGTNLDLVNQVTFAGTQSGEIVSSSATALTVNIPMYAQSGEVVLSLKNGETVTGPALSINQASYCYIASLNALSVSYTAGEIAQIGILNPAQLTDVKLNNSSAKYSVQGTELWVSIPSSAIGTATLTLISSDKSIEYSINVVASGAEQAVTIWEGNFEAGNWNGLQLQASLFSELGAGDRIRVNFTLDNSSTYWQMAIKSMEGGWPQYAYKDLVSGDTVYELEIDDNLANIFKNYGMVVTGCFYTASKIEIVK